MTELLIDYGPVFLLLGVKIPVEVLGEVVGKVLKLLATVFAFRFVY